MRIEKFSFGHITIDGITYQHDVVIDRGKIRKRVKKPSKKLRDAFRPYAVVDGRKDSMEVPPARHRHRSLRQLARYG